MKRRTLIKLSACALSPCVNAEENEYIIDIHQHVNFHGRRNPDFVAHQAAMGVSKTVLLPSGAQLSTESTHLGRSNGLAARIFGTGAAKRLTDQYPDKFVFFCNEIPDLDNADRELEKWLKAGAKGIGELKFNLECDSKPMQRVYEIAKEFEVPVLLHFQHGKYNKGFERFHKMLEKYPTVNFIGHAQTFWGNIDAKHEQSVLYPKGPVTPGGLTDRFLSDYGNMWGDLSAGSGLNSMTRDLDHAAGFFDRHQNKLCLGTDCKDTVGSTDKCSGSQMIAVVREMLPDAAARKKVYADNAKKIIKGL
ncbi:MAG: amidohydrolase family protein [Verrucomicrobiales bacterium]|nr:amidohydrolase family protein [Verrucomicrobiales bacterium]